MDGQWLSDGAIQYFLLLATTERDLCFIQLELSLSQTNFFQGIAILLVFLIVTVKYIYWNKVWLKLTSKLHGMLTHGFMAHTISFDLLLSCYHFQFNYSSFLIWSMDLASLSTLNVPGITVKCGFHFVPTPWYLASNSTSTQFQLTKTFSPTEYAE